MTTATLPAARTAAEPAGTNPAHRFLPVAAGVALVAGAGLFFAGMVTSPPVDGHTKAEYLRSLGADPMLTQVSAVLLHFANLLIGLGLLAVPLLVRGRRGAWATLAGAVGAGVGFLMVAGALLSDWYHMELARQLPIDQAVRISDAVMAHPLEQVSFNGDLVCPLFLLLTYVGLARAGVLGWWAVPTLIAGFVLPAFMPFDQPVLPALAMLPVVAVLVAAGLRVIARARLRGA